MDLQHRAHLTVLDRQARPAKPFELGSFLTASAPSARFKHPRRESHFPPATLVNTNLTRPVRR